MKTMVITKNLVEGYHNYPEAPQDVDFLKYPHRHIFHIECGFEVSGDNREIEIFQMQRKIDNYFKKTFGAPAQFENLSCEMIARVLMGDFERNRCIYIKVTEDGEGGAVIQR